MSGFEPPKFEMPKFEMPELPKFKLPWEEESPEESPASKFGWLNLDPHLPLPSLEQIHNSKTGIVVSPDFRGREIYLCDSSNKRGVSVRSEDFSGYYKTDIFVCDCGKSTPRRSD